MSRHTLRQRFATGSVIWRRFITWAVNNVTSFLEPPLLFLWAMFFVIGAKGLRDGIYANLPVIDPSIGPIRKRITAARIFWGFARTYTDTTRFHEHRIGLDWEVSGAEHLDHLAREESGIVLTAHMGNYDLGAYVFGRKTGRPLVMVRAPEHDPDADSHARQKRESVLQEIGTIAVQHSANNPVLDLLEALRTGSIVAIQGDRVVPGVADLKTSMFGHEFIIPAGPFALAMATGVKLWPLFIVRGGRRHYRAIAFPPIPVVRTGRDRDADMRRAADQWISILQRMIASFPDQWFALYKAFGAPAASGPTRLHEIPPRPPIPRAAHWAPARFDFALSRVIARLAGGSDAALAATADSTSISLGTTFGKRAIENNGICSAAMLLGGAAIWTIARPLGPGWAWILAITTPALAWMAVVISTGVLLDLTTLSRRGKLAAYTFQARFAFMLMTLLALFAVWRGNPAVQGIGWLWLILLAANTIAAIVESIRR